jgi:sulfur carrier protein
MTIWLNGEQHDLAPGMSLAAAVQATGADQGMRGMAVAIDGEVVPRAEWDDTIVADGQRIEVVQAVQGG